MRFRGNFLQCVLVSHRLYESGGLRASEYTIDAGSSASRKEPQLLAGPVILMARRAEPARRAVNNKSIELRDYDLRAV